MIEPFVEAQRREGCISYGLSAPTAMTRASPTSSRSSPTSIRRPSTRRTSRPTASSTARPTSASSRPTASRWRARSNISACRADVLVICLGKSTYARCGIIVNVTPLEPGWEGHVTLEFSNTTPLPAKIYANEGACQFLFLQGNEPCEVELRRPRRQIYGPARRDLAEALGSGLLLLLTVALEGHTSRFLCRNETNEVKKALADYRPNELINRIRTARLASRMQGGCPHLGGVGCVNCCLAWSERPRLPSVRRQAQS